MQRASVWLALFAIAGPGVAARAEQLPTPPPEPVGASDGQPLLERRALIQAVLERNPSLETARQAWRAAAEVIPQAASLDDPMASYSLAPLSVTADARFGEVLRFSQRIPQPGTLRLREEMAAAAASAAKYRVEEVRLRLATTASLLYDDYWLVDRALAITREHAGLLETFRLVATSRYATGLAPQQAPIQAEVEAARLLHRQAVLTSERRKLVARLNALLHRPASAPLAPAPDRLDADEADRLDAEDAVEAAPPSRPEVAARRAGIDSLRARVALEGLGARPDFEVMASYNSMWNTPEHRWTVGVGLRLPVRRKRLRASVAEAEARLAAGESELAALDDAVAAEVETARADLEEAEHVVRLYRDRVLPAARDQVAAARAGFETGGGSMLGLIDAQRSLLAAELTQAEAVAEVASARAALDRALGRMPLGWTAGPAYESQPVPQEGDLP